MTGDVMYIRISRSVSDPSRCDAVLVVAQATSAALPQLLGLTRSYWGVSRGTVGTQLPSSVGRLDEAIGKTRVNWMLDADLPAFVSIA